MSGHTFTDIDRAKAAEKARLGLRRPSTGRMALSLRDLAGKHTKAALARIVALMNDETQPGFTRLAAAKALLEFGHGRPTQHVAVEIDDSAARQALTRIELPPDVMAAMRDVWARLAELQAEQTEQLPALSEPDGEVVEGELVEETAILRVEG